MEEGLEADGDPPSREEEEEVQALASKGREGRFTMRGYRRAPI